MSATVSRSAQELTTTLLNDAQATFRAQGREDIHAAVIHVLGSLGMGADVQRCCVHLERLLNGQPQLLEQLTALIATGKQAAPQPSTQHLPSQSCVEVRAKPEHWVATRDGRVLSMRIVNSQRPRSSTKRCRSSTPGLTYSAGDTAGEASVEASRAEWVTLCAVGGERFEAFYDPAGRPLAEQLASYPPIPLLPSQLSQPCMELPSSDSLRRIKRKRLSRPPSEAPNKCPNVDVMGGSLPCSSRPSRKERSEDCETPRQVEEPHDQHIAMNTVAAQQQQQHEQQQWRRRRRQQQHQQQHQPQKR
jgi:hypothetical protein